MDDGKLTEPSRAEEVEALLAYMDSRTDLYMTLHKLYRWPLTQEELDALDAETFRQLSEELDDDLMSCGFNDMYRFLRRRHTGTRQLLSADYTKLFLGTTTYEGLSAQPYASLFVGTDHRLMGSARNKVRAVYRDNGVELSAGIDLPEDHLAFECEFLAIINERAADALRKGDAAAELLRVEAAFIEECVLDWFPRFYALALKLVGTRFYRGVLRMTKGFLLDEREVIEDLIADCEQLASGRSTND